MKVTQQKEIQHRVVVLGLTLAFSARLRQKTCRFLTRTVGGLKGERLQWSLIHVSTLMIPGAALCTDAEALPHSSAGGEQLPAAAR